MPDYTRTPPEGPRTELIDLPTACQVLGGVSPQTIYRLIKDGELELVKIRRRSLLTRASVDALGAAAINRPMQGDDPQ
jgi:excisionase family DNA binding protein